MSDIWGGMEFGTRIVAKPLYIVFIINSRIPIWTTVHFRGHYRTRFEIETSAKQLWNYFRPFYVNFFLQFTDPWSDWHLKRISNKLIINNLFYSICAQIILYNVLLINEYRSGTVNSNTANSNFLWNVFLSSSYYFMFKKAWLIRIST